ncbi:MAG: hypothetical protein WCD70_17195 [Alphaproteobacteria bacterium]
MSDDTLKLSEYAVQLTKAFQTDVGASHPELACQNALLVATLLIGDETRGDKMIEMGPGDVKTRTLAELFKTIAEKPEVKAALPQETQSIKLNAEHLAGLRTVSAYLKENGFSDKQTSISQTYLLTVAAASVLHTNHSTSKDVIELPQLKGTEVQKRQFWLWA